MGPVKLFEKLNEVGKQNGIGRLDLIENRYVGMKSRGIYETPGGTILLKAHRAIEELTLDSGSMHLKDELMPKYASLIYNGLWFAPEREMLQNFLKSDLCDELAHFFRPCRGPVHPDGCLAPKEDV